MKWLFIAVIIFAQQPTKVPERQRAFKGIVAQDAHQNNAPKDDKTIANPPQTIYVQQISSPHPKRDRDSANEGATQTWIEIFTGCLVAVGTLQSIVMLMQWCIYRRQAREMRRQRHEIRQQRHIMWRQWKAMGVQAGHMEGQLTQMSVQSGILQDSVELVINKERARIRIGRPEPLMLTTRTALRIEFRLFFYGSTPAFNISSEVISFLSDSRDSIEKGLFEHGIADLPTVASANDFTATFNDYLLKPLPLDESMADRIRNSERFVHFSGRIKYLDFFDKPRETAFHYRWSPHDNSANNLRRLAYPGGWEEVGGEKGKLLHLGKLGHYQSGGSGRNVR